MNRTVVLVLFLMPGLLSAQDSLDPQGSVTAGYRFTDVSGREQKYNELFNLQDGFRLHDLTLSGRTTENNRFIDGYALDASGIGGDPFAAGQFDTGFEASREAHRPARANRGRSFRCGPVYNGFYRRGGTPRFR